MPARESDNKNNQGWRKALRKNFGPDEKGRSYARQLAQEALETVTLQKDLSGSNRSTGKKIGHSALGGSLMIFGCLMLGDAIGHVVNWGYDGSVENDAAFHGDVLESPDDPSGHLIISVGDGGRYMLYRNDEGQYQLYEGEHENAGDYNFRRLPNSEAAVQAFDLMQDIERAVHFDSFTEDLNFYSFENISDIYLPDDLDGAFLYRAGDNITEVPMPDGWDDAQSLQTLFREASSAFETGNFIRWPSQGIIQDHPLEHIMEQDGQQLKATLYTWLGFLGLGAAYGAANATAQSRRRYAEEQKTKKQEAKITKPQP